MKTNIIHILIIAIILIAGWSLFTVLQDLYNVDSNKYDNYSMIGKGKQYLPLTPNIYSNQRKYPVYKPVRYSQISVNGSSRPIRMTTPNGSNSSYAINTVTDINMEARESRQSLMSSSNHDQNTRNSVIGLSKISKPFSKDMKIDAGRYVADASVSGNSAGNAMSEGSGMMKVFGGDSEGDEIEGGGGIENDNFYNDVPVGDGISLLIIMVVLYALGIMLKNRHSHCVKNLSKNTEKQI